MSAGFERQGKPNVPKFPSSPPKMGADQAKAMGYTGGFCEVCGSVRMRMAGHCQVCEECGVSTGCS